MATDSTRLSTGADRARRGVKRLVYGIGRLVADLLVVSLWVVFLLLLFLETGWPRWTFYGLLVVGVGVYVTVTATWVRGDG